MSSRYTKPQKPVQSKEKLLLTNASIINVHTGKLLNDYQILIQNGKITYILPAVNRDSVTADRELDLQGAYVLPGLINAHCHMTLPSGLSFRLWVYNRQVERNAEECIKHGVTTVRDMLAVTWGQLTKLKEKIAKGDIIGPRILSSFAMDVPNGYTDSFLPFSNKRYLKLITNSKQGREAVKRALDHGADFIKLFQQPASLLYPGKPYQMMDSSTIQAICEETSRYGKTVALHHMETPGFEIGLKGGVTSLEHMPSNKLLTEKQIQAFIDSGCCIVPTLTPASTLAVFDTTENLKGDRSNPDRLIFDEHVKQLPRMINEYLEPELRKTTHKYLNYFLNTDYANPAFYESRHLLPILNGPGLTGRVQPIINNFKALYKANAFMGCGNDGGIPLYFPGAMGFELYLLEKIGVQPSDALKMTTINNAKLLGMEKEIGSIEVGKIADIAVFEKNPLETARNTFNPIIVFKDGELVYRS